MERGTQASTLAVTASTSKVAVGMVMVIIVAPLFKKIVAPLLKKLWHQTWRGSHGLVFIANLFSGPQINS